MIEKAMKIRSQAAAMQPVIDDKLRDRLDNTPKRAKQRMSARIEGNHLARTQQALYKIADAIEAMALPPAFASLKKGTIHDYLRTMIDQPGYYDVVDTGRFRDTSPEAVAFRFWLDQQTTVDDANAMAERRRLDDIALVEMNLKFANIPGYFPTPRDLALRMVDLLDIETNHTILEPSAGSGALVEAIEQEHGFLKVTMVETNQKLVELLRMKSQGRYDIFAQNFLEMLAPVDITGKFSRILMNPPFENGQDIEHVQHAYEFLNDGGRMVAIVSGSTFSRIDRKAKEFAEWFGKNKKWWAEALPSGTFQKSGTAASSYLIFITKE